MQPTTCPACSKPLKSFKSLPLHIAKCPEWKTKIGVPPSEFNFDLHYGRELYSPDLVEGVDYVKCQICLGTGTDFRKRRLIDHLKVKHSMAEGEYLSLYPAHSIRVEGIQTRRKASTLDKYGVENVFQAEEIKAKSKGTSLVRYGVSHASMAPEVKIRREATNLGRYGSENPFGSKEVKKRLQDSAAANGWPAQFPEVRERRKGTILKRYGFKSYFETAPFKSSSRATCVKKYGAPHHMKSEEGRRTSVATFRRLYGVDNPLSSPAVQAKAYETNLRNHGGHHSQKLPEVRAKAQAFWMAKYGVDNPSKDPVIKAKIIDKIKERFMSGAIPRMTKPERIYDAITPDTVLYTGDWAYWVLWANKRRKNPDFVVLTEAQLKAYQAGVPLSDLRVHTVVEVNGDWWHTTYRGVTKSQREKEFIDGYASVGVTCVVVWESDLV